MSYLQSRDNATYECLAENSVGEPVRASATLHVYPGKFFLSLIHRIVTCIENCCSEVK